MFMKRFSLFLAASALTVLSSSGHAQNAPGAVPASPDEAVHLNEIQVIGTHNSYRAAMSPVTMQWLSKVAPDAAITLDYQHAPLAVQLDHGIRQIELDLYADMKGGRYAHPKGPDWLRKAGLTPEADPVDPAIMQGNDFKVMHIVDIDQRSTCQPLKACLGIIRTWSDAHPGHLPIFVDLETKQSAPPGKVPFTQPEIFTPSTYDRLDAELLEVFGRDRILAPDDVRGDAPDLNTAIRSKGWPSLAKARGKIVFVFERPHDTARYLVGHPALKGRLIFPNGRPGEPTCAFTEINEGFVGKKVGEFETVDNAKAAKIVPDLVRQGYLIRTRADGDTLEARHNDLARRQTALGDGAQLISTDYPLYAPARWNGYSVSFPGGAMMRCNPVNAPAACRDSALEPTTPKL